jgi:tetratricopeptide (TPR) repeat protein
MMPVVDPKPRRQSNPGVASQSPRVFQDALRVVPAAALTLPPRSRQLESIAHEADRHSRQGYELAGRGAHYAARSEFIAALRLVAQGLDAEHQTTIHGRALSAGLAAIREAQDFLPPRDRVEADVKVADIVARHQTPVLKGTAEGISAVEALKCYFTFAQEQFAAAVGTEVAGSMALHGLGKLHSALAERKEAHMPAAESKAVAFYQAALLVDPRNSMASNDLGVLLARSGYYAEARAALEQSVSVHGQPTGWRNLAQVYRRLGDEGRAMRAEALFQVAQRAAAAGRTPNAAQVQWLDPQAFAQSFAQRPDAREPLPVRQPAIAPQETAADKPLAQRPFSTLFEKRE